MSTAAAAAMTSDEVIREWAKRRRRVLAVHWATAVFIIGGHVATDMLSGPFWQEVSDWWLVPALLAVVLDVAFYVKTSRCPSCGGHADRKPVIWRTRPNDRFTRGPLEIEHCDKCGIRLRASD